MKSSPVTSNPMKCNSILDDRLDLPEPTVAAALLAHVKTAKELDLEENEAI